MAVTKKNKISITAKTFSNFAIFVLVMLAAFLHQTKGFQVGDFLVNVAKKSNPNPSNFVCHASDPAKLKSPVSI